jgi:CBS domain-containing protein
MKIREVMSKKVNTVEPDTRLRSIAKVMREKDIGAVPVADDDRLVGMITDRDLVVRGMAERTDAGEMSARDVMSGEMRYCFDDQTTDEVLENMGQIQVRRLPVVDREKKLVGMVSLGDLAGKARADRTQQALAGISR